MPDFVFRSALRQILCGCLVLACACEEQVPAQSPQTTVAPTREPASRPAPAKPIATKPPPLAPLPGGIDPMRDLHDQQTDTKKGHRLISAIALAAFQPKNVKGFRCNPPENTEGGVQGMV